MGNVGAMEKGRERGVINWSPLTNARDVTSARHGHGHAMQRIL
eukprot:SAG31_NODE_31417_length_368_cov_1.148699_1_plen_42_part_10